MKIITNFAIYSYCIILQYALNLYFLIRIMVHYFVVSKPAIFQKRCKSGANTVVFRQSFLLFVLFGALFVYCRDRRIISLPYLCKSFHNLVYACIYQLLLYWIFTPFPAYSRSIMHIFAGKRGKK